MEVWRRFFCLTKYFKTISGNGLVIMFILKVTRNFQAHENSEHINSVVLHPIKQLEHFFQSVKYSPYLNEVFCVDNSSMKSLDSSLKIRV